MNLKKLNFVIVIGLFATIGILVAQLLWTKQAFSLEEKKFSQRVHIALLQVVKKLYRGTNSDLPIQNPINKITNDYYIVNVENDFKPDVLEFYLKSEFKKFAIATDFEYAMYNCQSDEMVYGNYVSINDNSPNMLNVYFPKHKNFVYYFAVRFPNENSFLLSSMRFWFALSLVLLVILLVYVYSIYTILQQRKYASLQHDFINNMTHEFKTPLSSILIAANYIKNQSDAISNYKLMQYTNIIISQGTKLNQHVDKILTTSKFDNVSFVIVKNKTAVTPIICEVVETILLKYPHCKIIFNSKIEYFIDADRFHLANLMYNLIDNSIKYCAVQPEITISLTQCKKRLVLTFADNGIGIDKKYLPFIFDKFYRVVFNHDAVPSGFGLGLYYVKQIIDSHKWKINAESSTKNGLLISILIPYKNE